MAGSFEADRRLISGATGQVPSFKEGHLISDQVHMLIAIPLKYAVSSVIGYIKGKSAIHIARVYGERSRKFVGRVLGHAGILCPPLGEIRL